MQQLVNNLINNGWYLVSVDNNPNTPHSNAYYIVPPDNRQEWAANYTTVNYGALVIRIPHWAIESHTPRATNGPPPGMPSRFGKRTMW